MQSTLIKNQRETSSHFDRLVGFKSTHNNYRARKRDEENSNFNWTNLLPLFANNFSSPWWNINAEKKKKKC